MNRLKGRFRGLYGLEGRAARSVILKPFHSVCLGTLVWLPTRGEPDEVGLGLISTNLQPVSGRFVPGMIERRS